MFKIPALIRNGFWLSYSLACIFPCGNSQHGRKRIDINGCGPVSLCVRREFSLCFEFYLDVIFGLIFFFSNVFRWGSSWVGASSIWEVSALRCYTPTLTGEREDKEQNDRNGVPFVYTLLDSQDPSPLLVSPSPLREIKVCWLVDSTCDAGYKTGAWTMRVFQVRKIKNWHALGSRCLNIFGWWMLKTVLRLALR